MTLSRNQRLALAFAAATLILVAASGAYLAVSGARPGAPFFFVLAAAVALCATLLLLVRSALSLLFEPQADELRVATGRRRKELEREKQALLKALKELEFDHQMRKIGDADYRDIAAGYRARAVRVMRQLDEAELDWKQLVERDLAARRAARGKADGPAGAGSSSSEKQPEPSKVKRDVHGTLPDVHMKDHAAERVPCAACGTGNEPDAAFCKSCGARMLPEQAS